MNMYELDQSALIIYDKHKLGHKVFYTSLKWSRVCSPDNVRTKTLVQTN